MSSGFDRAQQAYDNALPPDGMDHCADCFRLLDEHCEECGECDCENEECTEEETDSKEI